MAGGHRVDDKLRCLASHDSDLEKRSGAIGADKHDEIVKDDNSDRVSVGMKDVSVGIPCFLALARMTGSTTSGYLDRSGRSTLDRFGLHAVGRQVGARRVVALRLGLRWSTK